MNQYNRSQLLTPPRLEEEIYPYRRVWPSLLLELAGLFSVAMASFIAIRFLNIAIPEPLQQPINIGLAISPVLLWIVFSRLREPNVPQPRQRMLSVLIVTALTANAIGEPLIAALDPAVWLGGGSMLGRIVGYAVTIGATREIIKYLVVRYVVSSDQYRIRLDFLAFTLASAYGYALVVNLRLVLDHPIEPDVAAFRIFGTTVILIAGSAFLAYGFAESFYNRRSLFLLPSMLVLAAFMHGLGITARGMLVNASFLLGIAGTRPFFAFAFSVVFIGMILAVVGFLFSTIEREEREAITSRELVG